MNYITMNGYAQPLQDVQCRFSSLAEEEPYSIVLVVAAAAVVGGLS